MTGSGLFAASMASTVGSAILGVIFAVVVGLYFSDARHLPGIGGTPGQLLIFVAGVTLTGATMVFDEGTIGLLRGGVQLWRNMAMSAVKLAVLPVLALFPHGGAYSVGISLLVRDRDGGLRDSRRRHAHAQRFPDLPPP